MKKKDMIIIFLSITIVALAFILKSSLDKKELYDYTNVVVKPLLPEFVDNMESEHYTKPIEKDPNVIDIIDHSYDTKFLISSDYSEIEAALDCREMYQNYGSQPDTACIIIEKRDLDKESNSNEIVGFEFRYTGDQTTN